MLTVPMQCKRFFIFANHKQAIYTHKNCDKGSNHQMGLNISKVQEMTNKLLDDTDIHPYDTKNEIIQ